MGWTVTYDMSHRADLIKDRTERQEWTQKDGTKVVWTTLRHCFRGNRFSGTLYSVKEVIKTHTDGRVETDRFIAVDLLRYYAFMHSWGYKDISESMGPCETSCPLSYFDMVPDPGGYATAWRAKVRARHANTYQKLEVGQVVTLRPGCKPNQITLISVRPLRGTANGLVYHVQRGMLAAPAPVTAVA